MSRGGEELSAWLVCRNPYPVGENAGELISEAVLARELGADYRDIGLTIHPHPTLAETFGFAAEVADGSITDILPPR